MERKQADRHANQGNPNSVAHRQANDNRANQKNPLHPVYPKSRAAPVKRAKAT